MKFSVLAVDYDGTIALHDTLAPAVRAAIEDLRDHGVVVILVTGRIGSADIASLAIVDRSRCCPAL